MKIKEISDFLEAYAPLSLQESYDNSGLLIGSPEKEINKALICLDVTDAVMDEAIKENCGLIIAHHPLIFKGVKKLTGSNLVERLIIRAIKNDMAIYAIHTNLDNIHHGVNAMLAEKMGLTQTQPLLLMESGLKKLVTFCPSEHADKVRSSIFEAGAGHIGNYDSCSYNLTGEGTFKGLSGSDPFVGEVGKLHFEKEVRIETIVPDYLLPQVINAMKSAHPYEEVAYDVYPLENKNPLTGAGMIGRLKHAVDAGEFLNKVKNILNCNVIRHSPLITTPVTKVAICGGSGSFLIHRARKAGAQLFITGDIKYHDFFDYHGEMVIADAGHYETEQFTKELLYSILNKNFPNFALLISGVNTNPVNIL